MLSLLARSSSDSSPALERISETLVLCGHGSAARMALVVFVTALNQIVIPRVYRGITIVHFLVKYRQNYVSLSFVYIPVSFPSKTSIPDKYFLNFDNQTVNSTMIRTETALTIQVI